jgi:hypothetical protein
MRTVSSNEELSPQHKTGYAGQGRKIDTRRGTMLRQVQFENCNAVLEQGNFGTSARFQVLGGFFRLSRACALCDKLEFAYQQGAR